MELHPVRITDSLDYPRRPSVPRGRRSSSRGFGRFAASLLISFSLGSCLPAQLGSSSSSSVDQRTVEAAGEVSPGQEQPSSGGAALDSSEKERGRVDRSIARCQPVARMAGIVAPPRIFSCGSSGEVRSFPLHLALGQTCAGQRSVARFMIPTRSRALLSFSNSPTNTRISLVAPDGTVAVVISPTDPCVQRDVEPGTWTLVAEPINANASQQEHFQISFMNG